MKRIFEIEWSDEWGPEWQTPVMVAEAVGVPSTSVRDVTAEVAALGYPVIGSTLTTASAGG